MTHQAPPRSSPAAAPLADATRSNAAGTALTESKARRLFVAVDSSTTACKVLIVDAGGEIHAEGRAAHTLENPEPDGYEQDARQWWQALQTASRAALAALATERRNDLTALVITHQRETVVLTDQKGEPLHPALVWMDARGRAQVKACEAELGGAKLHELSGKPACVTPSLYKLRYLLREKLPELAAKQPWVFDVHGFLVFCLTGERVTSLASADPLGLVDMAHRAWSDELLALAGLTRAQLPALLEPGAHAGRLSQAAARACDLPEGLPVLAGAGDGQMAGLGAGVTGARAAYLNLGTAVVSGVLAANYVTDRAFRTLYAATPGEFFLETDLKGGTFTLDWLADTFLGSSATGSSAAASKSARLASLELEARELGPGADGLMLLPYFCGVMNPYWDDAARGVTLGWRGSERPAHLYRAILEGIAFEQHLHTRSVEQATQGHIDEFVVMGGGSRSDLWCQIIADVSAKRVVRAATSEVGALGAALLGAVASGCHADFASAARVMTRTTQVFVPGSARARYAALYDVYRDIYPTLAPLLTRLRELT